MKHLIMFTMIALITVFSVSATSHELELKDISSLWREKWTPPKSAIYRDYMDFTSPHTLKNGPNVLVLHGFEITANISAETLPTSELEKKLKADGWETDNNVAADGHFGSTWGYKKGPRKLIISLKYRCVVSDDEEAKSVSCPDKGSAVRIFVGE